MAKTQLNKTRRELILEHIEKAVIPNAIDRTHEKALYDAILSGANVAIRLKYPEADMAILRKYRCTRFDRCLKFQFPTGRVDGFSFPYADEERLADMPNGGGCFTRDVFVADEDFETAFNEHALVKKANDAAVSRKNADYHSLVHTAKTVEDILAVMPLPDALIERLCGQRQALVAISPEVIERIKADFATAA
ncbi:hypothetical protein [Zavarzinella formosa]|uniref:hypothetical protein n=1 Tax=Zavarzinella formosa TaxID=360055 RepID=UPI00031756D0|nr:hypothetical protein [Zavarzinella formosa]